MIPNQIDFNFIDNKNNLLSFFKYDFEELKINAEENSEDNYFFSPGYLGNNFININPFSQPEGDINPLSLSTEENLMNIETPIFMLENLILLIIKKQKFVSKLMLLFLNLF